MSATLLILGCSVFVVLGVGHAVVMLFTAKFEPKDAVLLAQLKVGKTGLGRNGSLWQGIKGFHLSHSLGMMIYGGFYITVMLENDGYLRSSAILNVGLLVIPAIYVVLAHKFWFSVPRNCFIAATCLLAASIVMR